MSRPVVTADEVPFEQLLSPARQWRPLDQLRRIACLAPQNEIAA
ncbi:MAG: hypothetical protein R3E79_52050 [Caldilineaceae bacterium]